MLKETFFLNKFVIVSVIFKELSFTFVLGKASNELNPPDFSSSFIIFFYWRVMKDLPPHGPFPSPAAPRVHFRHRTTIHQTNQNNHHLQQLLHVSILIINPYARSTHLLTVLAKNKQYNPYRNTVRIYSPRALSCFGIGRGGDDWPELSEYWSARAVPVMVSTHQRSLCGTERLHVWFGNTWNQNTPI